LPVTTDQFKVKHFKKDGIGIQCAGFLKLNISFSYQQVAPGNPDSGFHLWKVSHQIRADRPGRPAELHGFRRCSDIADNTINAVGPALHIIIAQFKTHEEKDQKTDGHAHAEPQDIDKGKDPVPPEISECDFEIIFKHTGFIEE